MQILLFILCLFTFIFAQDPPVSYDASYTLDEDNQINIYLTATDSDGDALTFSIVNQPSNATLLLEGASATYMPNANYNGYDSFTFITNDGQFNSNEATISLTVMSVNDAPYLNDIQDVIIDSGAIFVTTLVAYDVDGDELFFSVSADNAYVSLDQNTLTIIPADDFSGMLNVLVTVSDGIMTNTTQFIIIVLPYEEDILGDINGDGIINVLDIVTIVNIVLFGPNGGVYNPLADLNEDGINNILDIVILVNWILNEY